MSEEIEMTREEVRTEIRRAFSMLKAAVDLLDHVGCGNFNDDEAEITEQAQDALRFTREPVATASTVIRKWIATKSFVVNQPQSKLTSTGIAISTATECTISDRHKKAKN